MFGPSGDAEAGGRHEVACLCVFGFWLLGGFKPLKQVVVTLDTTCTDFVLGWAVTCVIMKLPTTLCTFLFRETFLLQLLFVVRHGFQLLLTGVEGLIGPLGSLSGRGHGHALV